MARPDLLLVDDDPQMAILVGVLARRAGLTLVSRQDVESAWSSLLSDPPELVLLDMNLPGKRGDELLRRRNATPSVERCRTALFCQTMQSRDIAEGWKAGAEYLVAKDLVTCSAEWKSRVTEILEHVHGQRAIPSVGWSEEEKGLLGSRWGQVLNRVLADSALRSIGMEVVEQVLWRALVHGFGQEASRAWLVPHTGRLVSDFPPTAPENALRFFASILEQVWCLLGNDPSARLGVALRAGLAGQ